MIEDEPCTICYTIQFTKEELRALDTIQAKITSERRVGSGCVDLTAELRKVGARADPVFNDKVYIRVDAEEYTPANRKRILQVFKRFTTPTGHERILRNYRLSYETLTEWDMPGHAGYHNKHHSSIDGKCDPSCELCNK